MMNTVSELANHVGLKSACETLDFPRATFYRNRKEAPCVSGGVKTYPIGRFENARQKRVSRHSPEAAIRLQ